MSKPIPMSLPKAIDYYCKVSNVVRTEFHLDKDYFVVHYCDGSCRTVSKFVNGWRLVNEREQDKNHQTPQVETGF